VHVATTQQPATAELDCCCFGRRARFVETPEHVVVVNAGSTLFEWHKGADWAVADA